MINDAIVSTYVEDVMSDWTIMAIQAVAVHERDFTGIDAMIGTVTE
jgi:hypothetical protein